MADMRTLALTNPHMHGEDVKHAQTQLNKYLGKKEAHLDVDGNFGSVTGTNCKLAKWHLGFTPKECRRTYGPVLDNYLTGKLKPTHAMRKRAKARAKRHRHHRQIRGVIVANAKWGLHHAGEIHYAQSRPIDGLFHPHKLPLHTDCSGYVTDCYKWAGAPDPNGNSYNGQGYTGTLLNHMSQISRSQLKPADLIVYGYFPGEHVVIYIGGGMCISQGSEADPREFTLEGMQNAFSGPTHYLTLRGLH
jgi:hypothetical protein